VGDQPAIGADGGWGKRLWRGSRSLARHLRGLPPRIQALVDAELQRADILGAWVVFVVAAFLGSLYLAAPKALDSMGTLYTVPAIVGFILLLSLVRLRMAYRAPLGRTAQIVFIVADFGLLFTLIWSFHLHYHQPAAFYLKAPTFLFVFLLIAVRALRFEPLAVLISGLTAATGWIVMTVYALRHTPPPTVTRDFVDYMTNNVVLIGAEVEKIVAILLVTGVLTLAIVRGRRQVVLAASETMARDDLSRFFAPEIAARITHDDELLRPGYGEVRRGAILVCDIRGFTGLAARLPAGDVMALLVDYQRRMSGVIARHGGAIDKFLGDGILATFGCARPSATPAADALRTVLALLREGEDFSRTMRKARGQALDLGFAVTSGDVLCGTVGEQSRLEFTVIGDTVNLAAKLEKVNKTLGTAALADGLVVETAAREGFTLGYDMSFERFRVELPGVPEVREVVGWRRRAAIT
jgi:adenylate cyclase